MHITYRHGTESVEQAIENLKRCDIPSCDTCRERLDALQRRLEALESAMTTIRWAADAFPPAWQPHIRTMCEAVLRGGGTG